MREKRHYERPQLTIVVMSVQPQLLAGSTTAINTGVSVELEEEDW